jgi:hypothetical protein
VNVTARSLWSEDANDRWEMLGSLGKWEIAPAFENHDNRGHNTLADLERPGSKVVSLRLNTSSEGKFRVDERTRKSYAASDPV